MLKWTLRTPGDNLSCPPSPPNMNNICSNQRFHTDIKVDLEDSNKCWYETRVKVAQVKSTSKVVQFSSKENVHYIENDGREQISDGYSIFRRWVSSPNTNEDFERRRKRHHKHIKCNALDPLRIFTGDITDSDTGSVYMKLDKTPVALLPKEMCASATGPFDPRRRPLIDISNGDYSDIRKHLEQMPAPSTLHQTHQQFSNLPEQTFYEQLKPYKNLIIPIRDQVPLPNIPKRLDPIGGCSSTLLPEEDVRGCDNHSSKLLRTRSSLAVKFTSIMATTTTTATTSISTATSPTFTTSVYCDSPQMSRYLQYQEVERDLMRRRRNAKNNSWRKRHSIADIPSAFRRDNQFQASAEMQVPQEQLCRRARVRHIRDSSGESTLRGDSLGVLEMNGENNEDESELKSVKEKGENIRHRKSVSREEPIYEKIKTKKQDVDSSTTSYGSPSFSYGHNSYENALFEMATEAESREFSQLQTAYMSMKNLREPVDKDDSEVLTTSREDDYEVCIYSSSAKPNKERRAPIKFPDHHIYENALYLPVNDTTIPESDDNTCDFTSVPQQNVHKPVAIKVSNELIARFGKSPNDRQHPMPQYGLHISSEPTKKPCKTNLDHNKVPIATVLNDSSESSFQRHYENLDFLNLHTQYPPSLISRYNSEPNIYTPTQFHRSTGQHVHMNRSAPQDMEPSLPLYNLRPPPPPLPFNQTSQPKMRKKSRSCIKLDANLPVIYELQKQEEEMDCRRVRKYSSDLQSSYDSEENKSSDILTYSDSSPPCIYNANMDNLDSGMSEGIHTPLVSPMSGPPSPNSPRSDSLLGEAHTQLSLEDLQMYKENGYLIEENETENSILTTNYHKSHASFNFTEQSNISSCTNHEYCKDEYRESSIHNLNNAYYDVSELNVNHSTPIRPKLKESLSNYLEGKIKNTEMSQLLHQAVEKNLFAPETPGDYPFLNNSYKSVYNSSLHRRHSFASVKDVSSNLSKTNFHNDTSLWDVRNSSQKTETSCRLRKSQSFLSLSPATRKCHVSMTDKGVTEREGMVNGGGGSPRIEGGTNGPLPRDGRQTDEEEEGYYAKRPGSEGGSSEGGKSDLYGGDRVGEERSGSRWMSREGNRGREIIVTPGSFAERKEIRLTPDRAFTSTHLSPLPSSTEGNPTLPGVMREEISEGHLVPPSQRLSKHAVESLLTGDDADRNVPDNHLTEKQRRRQEESLFRLQCLLQKEPANASDGEEDNLSGDWSLEAVLDEASCSRDFDLSPGSSLGSAGSRTSSGSPELQDTFSVCTLDSDLADNVHFGSKLCDKIRQVSEEKMFAKLRRSFRKKEKYVPKVGIFMFVDNPMYVSPEVKKEAKIITFTPGKFRKSFRKKDSEKLEKDLKENNKHSWYVGNPMYNSPDPVKVKNKYSSMSNYSSNGEKENINNNQVPKPVICSNNNRMPLSDIWTQTNPCYESPDLKLLNQKNILNNQSPMKRKLYSPKSIKNKPLPSPPKQPALSLAHLENHYLTPILINRPVGRPPAPQQTSQNVVDPQQFIDHEYCTIPGEESDSWTSHSSQSSAKRTLKFDKINKSNQFNQNKNLATKSPCTTPSRMWRETAKTQQSTPRKYRGTLEKNVESAPFGDRGYKTPRAIKRERMLKCQVKTGLPPDLPTAPPPPPPVAYNLEDTSAFHHRPHFEDDSEPLEKSSMFQLPPDSIYESLSFVSRSQPSDNQSYPPNDNQRDVYSQRRTSKAGQRTSSNYQRSLPTPPVEGRTSRPNSGTTSGVCSICSSSSSLCSCSPDKIKPQPTSGVSSSSGISSSYSKYVSRPTPNKRKSRVRDPGTSNLSSLVIKTPSASLPTQRVKKTPKRTFPKKYKARDVLQGKGQLKLEVYENFGLLTIHIIEARRLRSNLSALCNPYAKISLVPDNLERTFCRTPLVRATNTPIFNQKFSFDFLPEDLDKRLLISLWNRDTFRKRSEFLGCMTFSVAHITSKRVSGWFRLLTEAVGRRKHFAVSFLNGSLDNSRKLGDIVIDEEKTRTIAKVPEVDKFPPTSMKTIPEYQNCPNFYQNINNNPAQQVIPSNQGPLGQTPYTISVNIQRNKDGFGFSVAWTRPPRVERVEPGKAADLAGLRPGDYIIFVGHQNVVKLDENSVLNAIRNCGDHLPLEVYRRGVSRTPKTLTNGWARPPSIAPADASSVGLIGGDPVKKNKIGHVTFSHENTANILEEKFLQLLTSEQRFCINCRFCVERYLIPLRFRVDIITPSAHSKLFTSIEQILDITETIVDRILDNDEDKYFSNIGLIYDSVLDHLVEGYNKYFSGISEADLILSKFLQEIEFVELLQNPPVPKRTPDLTTFIHLPCAHFREVTALLEDIVAVSPGRHDFYILRDMYEKLWAVYKDATSESTKEIKYNYSPSPLPPMSPQNRNFSPARKPLISVLDIESRLVFTKHMTPFKLANGCRKWLFGSELSKVEGRNLKQYRAMLFTDLLLLTSVNRDRVIYVMEDPIPLEAIVDADFHIKKKVMEFRLSLDLSFDSSSVLSSGDSTSYLSGTNSGSNSRSSTLSRGRIKRPKTRGRRCIVFRYPSVALKSTWENLIYRQIYACHRSSERKSQLARVYGLLSSSLFRAGSQDGTLTQNAFHVTQNRAESCNDLRPLGTIFGSTGEDTLSSLDNDSPLPRLYSCRSDDLDPRRQQSLTANYPSSKEPQLLPTVTINNYDDDNDRTKNNATDTEGIKTVGWDDNDNSLEESKTDTKEEDPKTARPLEEETTNDEQKEEEKPRLTIEEEVEKVGRSEAKTKASKKCFGGKCRQRLFSPRIQPPKKTENRTTKVSRYVNSLQAVDVVDERAVTPLFDQEESLNKEDFIKKRKEMLRKKPSNFLEGEEIVIFNEEDADLQSKRQTKELQSTRSNPTSINEQLYMEAENNPMKDAKIPILKLNGIEKESLPLRYNNKELLITPEDYEEYLDGRIERDYPELKEVTLRRPGSKATNNETNEAQKSKIGSRGSRTPSDKNYLQNAKHLVQIESQERNLNNHTSNGNDLLEYTFPKCELNIGKRCSMPNPQTGPLSGSSSMSFMDETTPTSVDGLSDFSQRTTNNKPKSVFDKSNSVELKGDMPKASFDSSSSESLNECSYLNGANLVHKANLPKIFTTYRQDSSASLGNAVTLCSNESSNSSMSISSTSVGSNQNPPKPRSILFVPAKNANSLPEISLQPPTPQAPKPRENYDAEKKIAYDLRVPGYSSMFLTVPGFDDYDEDRYLPGTKYESRTDESSENSDDDIVHKPRVFAALMGVAKKRGLKSYGSSCDLSKFGLSSPSDNEDATSTAMDNGNEDRINGNFTSTELFRVGDSEGGIFIENKPDCFEKVESGQRMTGQLKCGDDCSDEGSDSEKRFGTKTISNYDATFISSKIGAINISDPHYNESRSNERQSSRRTDRHLKRQSNMSSNSSSKLPGKEGGYDGVHRKDKELSYVSHDEITVYRNLHFGRSYSNEEPSKYRAQVCSQPISPIIRRMQSADSQGSPSRVRFSPVTDVYIRSSPESSDREDTEEGPEKKDEAELRGSSLEEEEEEDEDVSEREKERVEDASLGEIGSLSSISERSRTMVASNHKKDADEKGSPKKRFSLFRSQKKESTGAVKSSSSSKLAKGKRTVFSRSSSFGNRSSKEDLSIVKISAKENDETFL